jgi:hypothetical protein
MEEEAGIKEAVIVNEEKVAKEEIYTKVIRAGKRTYFFDVKATRKEDYYLTITESKKRLGKEGKVFYEKHKIFLYKEDFEKFADGLKDAVSFITNGREEIKTHTFHSEEDVKKEPEELTSKEFINVDFDDLGKK